MLPQKLLLLPVVPGAMTRRVYIGGLPDDITNEGLFERFSKYGQISSVEIAQSSNADQVSCRGFAHLTIEGTDSSWNKLRSTFNGSLWKGKKVRIENSHVDFRQKLENEKQAAIQTEQELVRKIAKKARKSLCRHARDMSLIDENNVQARKGRGWIRGKFGRPLAVVRLRRSNGRIETVDPAHHKEAYQRFYFGDKSCSVSQLHWTMDSFDETKEDPIDVDRERNAQLAVLEKMLGEQTNSSNALQIEKCSDSATDSAKENSLKSIFSQPQADSKEFFLFANETSSIEEPAVRKGNSLKSLQFKNIPFFTNIDESSLFVRHCSDEEIHLKWLADKEQLYPKIKSTHRNAKRFKN